MRFSLGYAWCHRLPVYLAPLLPGDQVASLLSVCATLGLAAARKHARWNARVVRSDVGCVLGGGGVARVARFLGRRSNVCVFSIGNPLYTCSTLGKIVPATETCTRCTARDEISLNRTRSRPSLLYHTLIACI